MPSRDHFRSMVRRPVSLRASVTTDSGEVGVSATVVDLGLGGACLLVARPLDRVARVCMRIVGPNLWGPLLVEGQVAWQRTAPDGATTRVGVRFEHRSGTTLLALVELIASHEHLAK